MGERLSLDADRRYNRNVTLEEAVRRDILLSCRVVSERPCL